MNIAKAHLRRLMEPSSIAVLGASTDADKLSGRTLSYLARLGYGGDVYPVNPNAGEIYGYPCYARISQVPGPVDVAVVLRPAAEALRDIEDCIKHGIYAFVLLGGGFAESGPEGEVMQSRLVDLCRRHGAVLCGPNCTGLINIPRRAALCFNSNIDKEVEHTKGGNIALISNSGSIASMILQDRAHLFNWVVATGNEAVLSTPDYISYVLDDEETKGVVAYMEGIRAPDDLARALMKGVELGKPVAICKAGRSNQAADIAASHTGAMLDDDDLVDALFRRHNVIRARTVEELKSLAALMQATASRSFGRRVGVATTSGGTAVLISDELLANGLELPPLGAETTETLRRIAPRAAPKNPIDVTGFGADAATFGGVVSALAEDTGFDVIIAPCGGAVGRLADARAQALIAAASGTSKLLIPVWQATTKAEAGYARLVDSGLPVHTDYAAVCTALAQMVRHQKTIFEKDREQQTTLRQLPRRAEELISRLRPNGRYLTEPDVKSIMAAAGISIPRSQILVLPLPDEVRIQECSFPVILKVVSRNIIHKSAVGGIEIVSSLSDLLPAANRILGRVGRAAPDATIDCLLVEDLVPGALELMVGVKRDPRFGLTIVLAHGGALANFLEGAVFCMLPLSSSSANDLVDRFAKGLGGSQPGKALVEFLLSISDIAECFGNQLDIFEVNPVSLATRNNETSVVALDGVVGFGVN